MNLKLTSSSLDSNEKLKIEIPNSSSLHQLKETISSIIPSSPSTSLHLSLNSKDEILASSPKESLHSLGAAFSLETLVLKPHPNETLSNVYDNISSIPEVEKIQPLASVEAETMDMADGSSKAVIAEEGNSLPFSTEGRLAQLLGEDVTDLKKLIFGVHAFMLDSGFICVDQGFIDNLPLVLFVTTSLRYSLPEILTKECGASQNVLLQFQTLGHFVEVDGSLLSDSSSSVHSVCLDRRKFAKPSELLRVNLESKKSNFDRHDDPAVYELWKMLKDGLVFPLLIDICENAGLEPPPSFMRLPTELKLMILEYTPAADLAKMACTCKELRSLSSNHELWKNKYFAEVSQITRGNVGFLPEIISCDLATTSRYKRLKEEFMDEFSLIMRSDAMSYKERYALFHEDETGKMQ